MEASKQSEVARKVAAFGLVESSSPPFRISVPAGHLDAAELELMPVLTADTLAARADRDSAMAQRADALAGRRRSAGSTADSGPEIIAPPQALNGDSTALEANGLSAPLPRQQPTGTAPARRPAAGSAPKTKKAIKLNKAAAVQKSTNGHNTEHVRKQLARAAASKKTPKPTASAR